MDRKKSRVTLALSPEERERLKATAVRKGVSMASYCRSAIDKEMAEDEANGAADAPKPHFDIEALIALQKQTFGDRILPTDSAEIVREAREARTRHLDSLCGRAGEWSFQEAESMTRGHK